MKKIIKILRIVGCGLCLLGIILMLYSAYCTLNPKSEKNVTYTTNKLEMINTKEKTVLTDDIILSLSNAPILKGDIKSKPVFVLYGEYYNLADEDKVYMLNGILRWVIKEADKVKETSGYNLRKKVKNENK